MKQILQSLPPLPPRLIQLHRHKAALRILFDRRRRDLGTLGQTVLHHFAQDGRDGVLGGADGEAVFLFSEIVS